MNSGDNDTDTPDSLATIHRERKATHPSSTNNFAYLTQRNFGLRPGCVEGRRSDCTGALFHHVGPGLGSIDEDLFVSSDLVAAEAGHPGEQVIPVGEDEFGHAVKADLIAFDVEGVPTLDVIAFVDQRHGGLARHQRYMVVLVVVGELLR